LFRRPPCPRTGEDHRFCRSKITLLGVYQRSQVSETARFTVLASRRKPLVLLVMLVALIGAAPAAATLSQNDRQLFDELNRVRAAHGLAAFQVDPALQNAARAHTQDMLRRGYFSHGDFSARLRRHGARGPRLGENLGWASGRNRARTIVRLWLQSPSHRQNVLRPGFRRIGVAGIVGRFSGRPGAMVATADFAGR
jgi:uncharacterized protein YkwD